MSDTVTIAPQELRDAFDAYKATADYKNTRKWAMHEHHVDGSLWSAWLAGRKSVLPEGYIAIPRDLTPEMRKAAVGQYHFDLADCKTPLQKVWDALIAAAPK